MDTQICCLMTEDGKGGVEGRPGGKDHSKKLWHFAYAFISPVTSGQSVFCLVLFPPTLPPTDPWEITMNEIEEKEVDEFNSSGLKCPTCFTVKGRECSPELKWCSTDKIKCVELSGIINTGA